MTCPAAPHRIPSPPRRGVWLAALALAHLWPAAHAQAQPTGQSTAVPSALRKPHGRIEVSSGLTFFNDQQTAAGANVDATGMTATQGRLFGVWYPGSSPVGVSLAGAMERFELRKPGMVDAGHITLTDAEAVGALSGQMVGANGKLAAELRVGYGYHQIPGLGDGTAAGSIVGRSVHGHGPYVGAALGVLLSGELALEASAGLIPVTFGAEYAGQHVSARRLNAGVRLVLGHFMLGSVSWSVLLGYDLGASMASGDSLDRQRVRHRVGVGLRFALGGDEPLVGAGAAGAFGGNEPPTTARLLGEPNPRRKPAEPPGRILGVVRGGGYGNPSIGDSPIPNIVIEAHATPLARTAADGSFVLDQVGPGPIVLRLIGEGWKPLEEVINVPPGKDVAVVLVLQKAVTVSPAIITGLVRAEDGKPVLAQVGIPELNLKLATNADGSFTIRVPAGAYTVSIDAPGFESQQKTVTVGTGEQSIYNVDLHKVSQ